MSKHRLETEAKVLDTEARGSIACGFYGDGFLYSVAKVSNRFRLLLYKSFCTALSLRQSECSDSMHTIVAS